MIFGFRALIAATAITLGASAPASAMLVQPIVLNVSTTGSHNTAALSVVNDRNRPDTIEIKVEKLHLTIDGRPELSPDNGDNFLIFPPTVTIPPGKTQVIRVRWVGDPQIAESQLYMFTVSELPVDEGARSGVQLVYAIQSLVTVSSPSLQSDVSVTAANRVVRKMPATQGVPEHQAAGVQLTFDNAGGGCAFIPDFKLTLHSGSWSKTLEQGDVSKAVGLGLLAPSSKRNVFVPVADIPASGGITVTLENIKG